MEGIGELLFWVIYLAFIIFILASLWIMFTKAGKSGWLAIIPIVNFFVIVDIAGKPWWWGLLLFIPLVNIVIMFLIWKGVAENFGHGTGFALGLFFLGFIFVPILAFGDSQYIGGRKQKIKNAY